MHADHKAASLHVYVAYKHLACLLTAGWLSSCSERLSQQLEAFVMSDLLTPCCGLLAAILLLLLAPRCCSLLALSASASHLQMLDCPWWCAAAGAMVPPTPPNAPYQPVPGTSETGSSSSSATYAGLLSGSPQLPFAFTPSPHSLPTLADRQVAPPALPHDKGIHCSLPEAGAVT